MTIKIDCPFGFEDGHIVGYAVNGRRLLLEFVFWNERTGVLEFDGVVAVSDYNCVGAEIGSVLEREESPLVETMRKRLYSEVSARPPWKQVEFCDVSDNPVMSIVAESVKYRPTDSA